MCFEIFQIYMASKPLKATDNTKFCRKNRLLDHQGNAFDQTI